MTPAETLLETARALDRGEPTRAIELSEAVADRGERHADLAFNRGLAYVARARGAASKPGDLGRAAAAFEETLLLRPGDEAGHAALEAVRLRVAERRVKQGGTPEMTPPDTPLRDLARRAPVDLFPALALAFAVATAALFLARRRAPIVWTVAGAAWLVTLGLSWVARDVHAPRAVAIVVTDEARWVDAEARPREGGLPETTRLDVLEERGAVVRVRAGKVEGFVRRDAVVVLAK